MNLILSDSLIAIGHVNPDYNRLLLGFSILNNHIIHFLGIVFI